MSSGFEVDPALVERFRGDLAPLVPPSAPLGIAVSGGPDSLALLLLASAARPDGFEAVTVDHALRPESRDEAAFVGSLCRSMGVPHTTCTVSWTERPQSGTQEKARAARYEALGRWAADRKLSAILTGHHRDDQAETLLMRLVRGSGLRGLAAMRPLSSVPGHPSIALVRPLLAWRQSELEQLCVSAAIQPVRDPANLDLGFERVRMRSALRDLPWLDPEALARSAAILARADDAVEWAVRLEFEQRVSRSSPQEAEYRPSAPSEVRRRVIAKLLAEIGTEGAAELRGRELDRLLLTLESGGTGTLRGVLCHGGDVWRFHAAPPRRS